MTTTTIPLASPPRTKLWLRPTTTMAIRTRRTVPRPPPASPMSAAGGWRTQPRTTADRCCTAIFLSFFCHVRQPPTAHPLVFPPVCHNDGIEWEGKCSFKVCGPKVANHPYLFFKCAAARVRQLKLLLRLPAMIRRVPKLNCAGDLCNAPPRSHLHSPTFATAGSKKVFWSGQK
jgi:hypothetical protein